MLKHCLFGKIPKISFSRSQSLCYDNNKKVIGGMKMLKSKVGYSKQEDAFTSGKETATQGIEGLENPKIAMFYASKGLEEYVKGAKSVIGTIPLIGSTSKAIMVPDGMITDEQFSGMMVLDDEEMVVAISGNEKGENPRETAKWTALEAIKSSGLKIRPSYFYLVTSAAHQEEYLKGIEDVIGRVPCFGGSVTTDGQIFCNEKMIQEGCAVAFFYSGKDILTEYGGTYRETSDMAVVTEIASDNQLVELDHEKALEKYAAWRHMESTSLKAEQIHKEAILSPLAVKTPLGEVTLLRGLLFGQENGAITTSNPLEVGTAVIRMEATVDECIKGTKEMLDTLKERLDEKAGAYFLIHSEDWKQAIDTRMEELLKKVKESVGDTPFLMVFTSSEYGYQNHSANACGSLMLSFTVLGE